MVDMNNLVGKFLGSGFAGGMAGGAATSMLLSKSGRKLGGKALKLGGIAAVGALAYTAYQKYNKSKTEETVAVPAAQDHSAVATTTAPSLMAAPLGSAFMPKADDDVANEALGLTLVRAMIAASRSDGRLDAQESQSIFQKIQSLELDNESQSLLIAEMGQPVDMDTIVNSASSPEIAAEIYTASLLAIDVDTLEEKAYLSMLSARLQLPAELVVELERQVSLQK